MIIEPILMEPILMEPILMEPIKSFKIKYSYNHFKGSKKAFNSNICKSINIISFGRVAMLECFKSASNKIFILKGYKNKIILKIIIIKIITIKIILLINTNVNDIKYQKPQKLKTLQDSQLKSILFQ